MFRNFVFQCQGLFSEKVMQKLSKNKIKINSFIINLFSDVFQLHKKKNFYLNKKKGKLNIEFSVSHFKQIV